MKEIELIGKRKPREKHFLREKGIIEAQVFDEDIHFLKDGTYEEIDNTLIDMGNYYTNKNNAYKVTFAKTSKDELTKISIGDNYIKTKLVNCNLSQIKENIMESKLHKNVCYPDILNNIDLEYNIMPAKVKEAIILKSKDVDLEKLVFSIETNMELELLDKKIVAKINDKTCFGFDAPYMIDADFKTNNDVNYELSKLENNQYLLKLNVNKEWITDEETKYPVMIDPTITNSNQNNSVYDTYIYPGDTGVDRNSQDILKAGFETINGTKRENRALIKFELPTLGTGSQVIGADLQLYGYPENPYNYNDDVILVHQITSNWDESTATWDNMNDKYDSLIEGAVFCRRGYYDYENETIVPANCGGDITRLVRKWYTGTPNNGIMLKQNPVKYNENILPAFYSKNNSGNGGNPKPVLSIYYRNQNGLLDYMDYQTQDFAIGKSYVNSYNGNLTTIFNIGQIINGNIPIELNLIYNTNDVILNNDYGYGLGYKLNLHQTIMEQIIDGKTYLEYCDADGTLHYFLNQKTTFGDSGYNTTDTENIYYDEDGLNMTITKNNDNYILKDKNDNTMKFIKSGDKAYLYEIEDVGGNKNVIKYDENKRIVKVINENNDEINISYTTNNVTIVSPHKTITVNYLNNHPVSIDNLSEITNIEYNSNNIIIKILDVDNMKTTYEYYNQIPYKVKKVSLYGSEGTLGDYFELLYGFDSTNIIDAKNNTKNMIFNSQGVVTSISRLNGLENLKGAYGLSKIVGENNGTNPGYNNKLLRKENPIGYVKNLLSNTSFEGDINYFSSDPYSTATISEEASNTGVKSLKIISHTTGNQIITYNNNIECQKGKYYTFSCYVKNNNKLRLQLGYSDSDNQYVEMQSDIITPNNEFERHDVTIYFPEDAVSDLLVKFKMLEVGTAYIDDIQLEEGEVANNYNLLENSDFSNGFSEWTLDAYGLQVDEEVTANDKFEVVTLENDIKALRIKLNPAYAVEMKKVFNINGKAGDLFNISFWYKNQGIDSNLSMHYGSRVYVIFKYVDSEENGGCVLPSPLLNINDIAWQYVSNDFVAERDYTSITLLISHEFTANDFYITNMNLFKDVRNVYYNYDENGNVILENNLDNKNSEFNYNKNNQLIQMINPKGKNFMFEYDNIVTDRVINGISDMGISNKFKYNENNKPISTKVINDNINGVLTDGIYKIRLKGTSKYLRNVCNEIKVKLEDCKHDLWNLEKSGEYFKIYHSIITNKYFTIKNGVLVLSIEDGDNSLFKLNKNKNGSYAIKSKLEDKYLKYDNNEIVISTYVENDYNFEFYFETTNNDLFIENNAIYSDDGKYIKCISDTLLRERIYDTDPVTGLIYSITNFNGNSIKYSYNSKNQVSSIKVGDRIVNYEYNNKNLIKEISEDNRKYKFNYNEFGNVLNVKIGNNIDLITNVYDRYGNLSSIKYGNNNTINYTYDEFDRVDNITKNSKNYKYRYNSTGDLVKIISNDFVVKYTYDLCKRLSKYENNGLSIKYKYDINQNVIGKKYKLDSLEQNVDNIFNDDDLITNITFNNNNVNYTYDELGRISNINFDNGFETKFEYVTIGNRTSLLVKKIKLNNDSYSYSYDKVYNITHIYKNDSLINRYYYDKYNQLILEKDYLRKYIIEYKYDKLGNILCKRKYDLNSFSFVTQDKYNYDDSNWADLLTAYNGKSISYDEIGNPIKIGINTNLTWENGRELKTYIDDNYNISYTYNHIGLRIGKIVNGMKTKYYLENDNIIFEINNNKLYYMYDDDNDLIAFKLNNDTYYYVKNAQNDIIGILNSNNKIVAKYKYDSWGKIISITDEDDVDISSLDNHVANLNPFRYRSYYYDKETELYYINNRYYNPNWGRFINADGIIGANKDISSYNLFVYCSNNPINNLDCNGLSILSKLKKKVKKVVKKVAKTVKKAVQTAAKNINKAVNSVKSSFSMVARAVTGGGKAQHFNNNSNLVKTLAKSDILSKEVDKNLNDFRNSNQSIKTYSSSISFYDDKSNYDFDLQLAIGLADYTMTISRDIEKVGATKFYKYTVEVNLYDDFGFDGYRNLDDFAPSALNNVGMLLQDVGIFKSYDWDTSSITFYRYEEIYD